MTSAGDAYDTRKKDPFEPKECNVNECPPLCSGIAVCSVVVVSSIAADCTSFTCDRLMVEQMIRLSSACRFEQSRDSQADLGRNSWGPVVVP